MGPDEESVHRANQAFYRAFESLDLARMDEIWWHEGQVTCIHPGWPLAAGWPAVRESWTAIFRSTERIEFDVVDEYIDVAGDFAWVVCTERLRSRSASGESGGEVLATNVFRRRGDAWRLVHHHAAPFVDPSAAVAVDVAMTRTRRAGPVN